MSFIAKTVVLSFQRYQKICFLRPLPDVEYFRWYFILIFLRESVVTQYSPPQRRKSLRDNPINDTEENWNST